LYEQLITRGFNELLSAVNSSAVVRDRPDPGDTHIAVANHIRQVVERALRAIPEDQRLARQAELCNAVLEWFGQTVGADSATAADELIVPLEVLREVRKLDRGSAFTTDTPRPLVPLSSADLLVNARGEPSVGAAVEREICSADRIDLICAFIRWNGLRLTKAALEAHRAAGRPLRVITTVYTGSTERRALDWLASIGAQVKVSYDTRTTRLHAKAWMFERDSGFSTAFIGSSNLTHSAMIDGVEWNVRLAQASTPALLDKFRAAFEGYWADLDYETYDPARDAERFDRAVQRVGKDGPVTAFHFELQPWPFQREMLERLQTERERHGRYRNLVVAATGTGKTLVAAFDYRRLRGHMGDASLLFVAHRREILEQSLFAYRSVLRDGAFGELLVDGQRPSAGRHVFASVQSLSRIPLGLIPPDAFDVVVVDEFHHAEAPTYRRLLEHLRPKVLLGLTATPERTDGQSVLGWFDNRIAVELRLWDALDRGLLCPFQYFGLSDNVDLSQVAWSRRGYDAGELENIYTGNHRRVAVVLTAIQDRVAAPEAMRALGFCVSVAHAEFMAREFSRHGFPAVAVSANSSAQDRDAALRDLRDGKLRAIFCVDLFNEGVDVPEIDTVLFLRPTESALIFVQQMGRGLRRTEEKACLTVLDFIGNANRRFRFDLRLRALVGGQRSELIQQIEEGFPRLPSGCAIQLDRVAAEVVLQNVKQSLGSTFAGLVSELRAVADARRHSGLDPDAVGLSEFLASAGLEVGDLYKGRGWTWSRLKREAGLRVASAGPDERRLSAALQRLLHVDDPYRLGLYRRAARLELTDAELDSDAPAGRALSGLHFALWGLGDRATSLRDSFARFERNEAMSNELVELLEVLGDRAEHLPESLDSHIGWEHRVPLAVHSRASLTEILAAFGRLSLSRRSQLRQGVDYDRVTNTDLFFVTLEKAEGHYSPSTMYRDYAIAPDLFHWESQSTTSVTSPTGRRYLDHGSHVLLFVRHRKHEAGLTAPYMCLGAAEYVSHQGSRPIAITWRLRKAMPQDFFKEAKVAAG
jgi:superfamily II DNA or RNA helicase/HKD family nuclease